MKNEKQNKIEIGALAQEMKLLLQEEFVAVVTEENNVLTLRFPNGQSFCVRVEEI